MGFSKHHLSGPLMEKMEVAVYYISTNNLDTAGVSLQKLMPQTCFVSETGSIRTQTDLITNLNIERFIRILNGDDAAEFSKIMEWVGKKIN